MSRKRPERTSKNEKIRILILCTQQCSEKDRHSRSLSDLLQVPISHIRTYKAFAQHALEATPTSSPDYVCLVLYFIFLSAFCFLFLVNHVPYRIPWTTSSRSYSSWKTKSLLRILLPLSFVSWNLSHLNFNFSFYDCILFW